MTTGTAVAISNAQKAVIHVAKTQLRMAEEDYRALLQRCAGVGSSMDLEEAGFLAVMAEFERLGFHHTIGRAGVSRAAGMATPKQLGMIRSLWKGWHGEHDDASLCRWIESKFGVSHINFLAADRAGRAIAVLKRMNEHPNAKRPSRRRSSPEGIR